MGKYMMRKRPKQVPHKEVFGFVRSMTHGPSSEFNEREVNFHE